MSVEASLRKDDLRVVVKTDAYVSHQKQRGPWISSFSMSAEEAHDLRDALNQILGSEGQS